MASPVEAHCAFCKMPESQVTYVIKGLDPDVFICDKCVEAFHGVLAADRKPLAFGAENPATRIATPSYYKAVCDTDAAAIQAYHATDAIFDALPEVSSLGKKRFGNAILYRFDNSAETVATMVQVLRQSGHFQEVSEVSEEHFWTSPSNGV
jgi:hypothetical protein